MIRPHFRPLQRSILIRLRAAFNRPAFSCAVFLAAVAVLAGCRGTPRSYDDAARRSSGIFRDVTKESGLHFRWGHGGKSPLNIIETLGHGTAFLDFDQDGLLDLFLAGTPRCALYRNTGGKFEDVTDRSGVAGKGRHFGVAVGDYDNDGDADLFVSGYGNSKLYRNEGHAHFSDQTKIAGVSPRGEYDVATAAAFADLDSDGLLDLIVCRYIKFTPESVQFCTYSDVQAGCGVKNYEADLPSVYRNLGSGRFKDYTREWGFDTSRGKSLGIAIRAPDSGRGVEVYVANDEEPCDLFVPNGRKYRNDGLRSGTAFGRDGLTQAGMGADWGDFNLDGRVDLVVATYQTEPKPLYRSDGDGLYSEVGGPLGIAAGTGPYVAWTARFFDYDNDRWPDLLFTNGHTQDNVNLVEADRTYPQPLLLYHNERGEQYVDVSSEGGAAFRNPIVGRGGSFGDYDDDGDIDVLIVNDEGGPLLLRNEGSPKGHWIGIRLVGRKSNRDGIGARVEVVAKRGRLVKDHQLAGGYISSHDPRMHFGLGDWDSIQSIRIRWPSGKVDTVLGPPVDRYVTIEEGSGRFR